MLSPCMFVALHSSWFSAPFCSMVHLGRLDGWTPKPTNQFSVILVSGDTGRRRLEARQGSEVLIQSSFFTLGVISGVAASLHDISDCPSALQTMDPGYDNHFCDPYVIGKVMIFTC